MKIFGIFCSSCYINHFLKVQMTFLSTKGGAFFFYPFSISGNVALSVGNDFSLSVTSFLISVCLLLRDNHMHYMYNQIKAIHKYANTHINTHICQKNLSHSGKHFSCDAFCPLERHLTKLIFMLTRLYMCMKER